MKRGPGKQIKDQAPFQLYELDNFARDIHDRVSDYITQSKRDGIKTSAIERLVDLSRTDAEVVWRAIDSLGRTRRGTDETADQLEWLLTGIASERIMWGRTDLHSIKDQHQTIQEIGRLASRLTEILANAKQGYVTDFLKRWESTEAWKALKMSGFTKNPTPSTRTLTAWYRQKEMFAQDRHPFSELLVRLANMANTAKEYRADLNHLPVSQIGVKSQKKDEVTFFVIRLHINLESIFGKVQHHLNAALSSLVFDKPITHSRVEEIIERARDRKEIRSKKRGDISPKKSKKSPRV